MKIKDGESIPADLVLLVCSETEGEAFLQTANLDGERTLKRKMAILQEELANECTVTPHREEFTYQELLKGARLDFDHPVKKFDIFEGRLLLNDRTIPLSG